MIKSLEFSQRAVAFANQVNDLPAVTQLQQLATHKVGDEHELIERYSLGAIVFKFVFAIDLEDVFYTTRFSFPNDTTRSAIEIVYDASNDSFAVYWIFHETVSAVGGSIDGLEKNPAETMTVGIEAAKKVGATSGQPRTIDRQTALQYITTLIDHALSLMERDINRM